MLSYCFVGDLLGFSKLIMNLEPSRQNVRIQQWIDLVRDAANEAEIPNYQLVSDTVFASVPPNEQGLRKLIKFSQILLENGCAKAFPLRGGITKGDINWNKEVTFGQGIVEAYKLENNQNWMGVVLQPEINPADSLWSWAELVCYPAPMKTGVIRNFPVVAWDVPMFDDFVKAFTSEGLTSEGEQLTWDWGNKVQSTILFGLYLRIMRTQASHLNPRNFVGLLPIELFDRISLSSLFVSRHDAETSIKRITLGCPPGASCSTSELPKIE